METEIRTLFMLQHVGSSHDRWSENPFSRQWGMRKG